MTAAAAEAEARWRDHPLDAIALIRASINYDTEGEDLITRYADTDHVVSWLTVLARAWLFNACGLHNGVPLDQVVEVCTRLPRQPQFHLQRGSSVRKTMIIKSHIHKYSAAFLRLRNPMTRRSPSPSPGCPR